MHRDSKKSRGCQESGAGKVDRWHTGDFRGGETPLYDIVIIDSCAPKTQTALKIKPTGFLKDEVTYLNKSVQMRNPSLGLFSHKDFKEHLTHHLCFLYENWIFL